MNLPQPKFSKMKQAFVSASWFLIFAAFTCSVLLAQSGGSNYEDYNTPVGNTPAQSQAEKIVERNIKRTYDALNDYAKEHGKEQADFASEQKNKETRFGHQGPSRNPLDQLNGRLDPVRSWNEYKTDSKIILSEATFPTCFEPRMISERKNRTLIRYDYANELYTQACALNCPYIPPTLFTPPFNRNFQVVTYYWPEYQVSVNKAGAQMIDPDIVRENRGTQELYRLPTSIKEKTDSERGQQAQLSLLMQMGIPTLEGDKFKDPDYHQAAREFHLRQDGELRYPSAMRPNAFWRAANARRRQFAGYKSNSQCLFNALDPPTSQRKVIANRYDQGIYSLLARYPELRKRVDQERYRYTSPLRSNIQQYKQGADEQFKTSLCASWRMGSNSSVYGELSKVGFSSTNNPKYKDYCLPGGYDLSGSMVHTEGTPMLQADAARVAMAAIWFGSTNGNLSKMNTAQKRTVKYSYYKKRANSNVPRFVGTEQDPGDNESKIVFVDKLQRIYPTQQIGGNPDGKMGASSKTFRTDLGQRGSQCFRPEDIPNWSSEGRTNKTEWPLGLVGGVEDHFGETRWAIWNRRVVCACEDFGLAAGCLNLNGGDDDETVFAGTLPAVKAPPAFEKALPLVKGFANQSTPPGNPSRAFNGFNLNGSTVDVGRLGSGFTRPVLPIGQQVSNEPNEPIDPSQFMICMLAEDRNGNQQQNQNNQQQNQGSNQQQGQGNQQGQSGNQGTSSGSSSGTSSGGSSGSVGTGAGSSGGSIGSGSTGGGSSVGGGFGGNSGFGSGGGAGGGNPFGGGGLGGGFFGGGFGGGGT